MVLSIKSLLKRKFTKELEEKKDITVYDLFNWKLVDIKLTDYKTGTTLFEKTNLEFPEFYSQNACDIIATKYFRLAGVPTKEGYERSLKEVVHRMVDFWTNSACEEGLIDNSNKQIFYDEMAYAFINQMVAVNSPQWFNTGLKRTYGIQKESDGHFYYDEKLDKVVESKDAYSRTQGSACFIIGVEDKLLGDNSITDLLTIETRLFKQGSGTGTNFSSLRSKGESLSGGGTSSGLMSFLKVFDRNTGAIKSGGTTRRAAKMVCLNADHPEIMDFITWKSKEEDKVVALGKMGYDMDFNGEAYETVSGQNSNNSVRFTDDFMKKVTGEDSNTSFELKGRLDNKVNKEIDSLELWEVFNKAAHRCADPAPQFHDRINAWHTCPAGQDGNINAAYNQINSSNPCSEYHFLDNTACNLASINVYRFYNETTGEFDVDSFKHVIFLSQLVLESTIYQGQFPTREVARNTYLFRTTGLGIANTGMLHMAMGHAYDSEESRAIASTLTGIVTGYSYFISALMAKEVGTFKMYELNKPHMLKVIRNHSRVAGTLKDKYESLNYKPIEVNHTVLAHIGYELLGEELKDSWKLAMNYGEKYGYRNAQVSVIAPTGTIAFAMDCATTSIEPFFAHIVYKKLVGGGFMEIVNPVIPIALKNLGYRDNEIEEIVEYIMRKTKTTENGYTFDKILDGKIEGAPYLKPEHLKIFDTANVCGTGERFINPMGHVKMVAALTPLVSGAISKTVNLPNNATIDDFKKVHIESWRLGVKCISLYRDGSKASQPLNSSKKLKERKLEDMTYVEIIAYTKSLEAKIKEMQTSNDICVINEISTDKHEEELEVKEGYHKVKCSKCGSEQMIPNGTCSICRNCGTTTGCS